MTASDRYTIIRTTPDDQSETVATGLSRDEAERWLKEKARESGHKLQDGLVVPATSKQGESWQAVKAE